MNEIEKTPMKPQQYAEHKLLMFLLNHTYPPGSQLPNERELAERIGVTRPTLRETLQRLAREKWLTIRHGKKTIVNDYWRAGGLGMLATMARYAEFLPADFIPNLLDFRIHLLPPCAAVSVGHAPDAFLAHLAEADTLGEDARRFTAFDWELQVLMVTHSRNLIYPLILNDFSEIYQRLGLFYFRLSSARSSSMRYYRKLRDEIKIQGDGVESIVRDVMRESLQIWKDISSN